MNEKQIFEIISFFYPEDDDLRKILLLHSSRVKQKALELAERTQFSLNKETIAAGAMLHDIGIRRCHAPGILCAGELHYICHGIAGAEMLRRYGEEKGVDLEVFASVCERHTGSGLTAADIISQKLPLPERDFLPQTPEEKIICLADKFFSKSGTMEEKSFGSVQRSMAKFGAGSFDRFNEMWEFFKFRNP